MREIFLNGSDGYKLTIHIFEVTNPKGFIQLIHGMEEHQERYEDFIEKLNEAGYTVISSDMRGHGKDCLELGYFADRLGNDLLVSDQMIITEYIKREFKANGVIIFAHSMGTIITRKLLQTKSSDYERVILSGYPYPKAMSRLGLILGKIIALFKGKHHFSPLLEKMAVGVFNKDIKNPKTSVDWLSHNEENVNKYIEDPLCGKGFKTQGFLDLFHLVIDIRKPKKYRNVNQELKILTLRGEDDPCTGYEKGSKKSLLILKKAGFKNIRDMAYPKMRHEILNEDNRDLVYNDVIDFLTKG